MRLPGLLLAAVLILAAAVCSQDLKIEFLEEMPPAAVIIGPQRLPDLPDPRAPCIFRGQIVDAQGDPVVGAGVTIGDADSLVTSLALTAPLARTKDDGRFEFALDPPTPEEGAQRRFLLAIADGHAALQLPLPAGQHHAPTPTNGPWRRPKTAEERRIVTAWQLQARLLGRAAAAVSTDGIAQKTGEVDCGRLELKPGVTVTGRVRDAAGGPVAGARVVASDLLVSRGFQGIQRSGAQAHVSYATTGADGRFTLPGVFATGAELVVRAEGFFSAQRRVFGAEPDVEIDLSHGGTCKGRVLGKEGQPATADLKVLYETSDQSYPEKVDKDGTFEFTRRYPHRYRILATPTGESAKEFGPTYSAVLDGPEAVLELALEPKKKAAEAAGREGKVAAADPLGPIAVGHPVTVVDAHTGYALADFKASLVWVYPFYEENRAYIEGQFAGAARPPLEIGYTRVPGPSAEQFTRGILIVQAPGYATSYGPAIEWDPTDRRHLRVEMVPESILAGVVRERDDGSAVAGARVSLRGHDAAGRPGNTTTMVSGVDGRFQFRGLSAMRYRLTVTSTGRASPPVEIELGPEEKRADVVLNLEPAVRVHGRLRGVTPRAGWQAMLVPAHAVPSLLRDCSQNANGTSTALADDGAFEFENVRAGIYELALRIERDPRVGASWTIPIEPLRVRSRDVLVDVDASVDLPGRLRGRIVFTGVALPWSRLIVVATPWVQRSPYSYYYNPRIDLGRSRSSLDAEGRFDLDVPPGQQQLAVIDLETGVTLAILDEPLEIAGGQTKDRDLEVALTRVKVVLKANADGVDPRASWMDLEVEQPRDDAFQMFFFWSHSTSRKPIGISLLGRGAEIDLILPPFKTRFRVHTDYARLSRRKEKPPTIIGDEEFQLVAGEENRVEIGLEHLTEPLDPDPEPEKKEVLPAQALGGFFAERRAAAKRVEAEPAGEGAQR